MIAERDPNAVEWFGPPHITHPHLARTDVPVGVLCLECAQPIEAHDQGFTMCAAELPMNQTWFDEQGFIRAVWHQQCLARAIGWDALRLPIISDVDRSAAHTKLMAGVAAAAGTLAAAFLPATAGSRKARVFLECLEHLLRLRRELEEEAMGKVAPRHQKWIGRIDTFVNELMVDTQ